MIQLRTLGRLDLTGATGETLSQVIGQPKRAGLLVYLALAEPRGFHRRDTLVAMFWPELETARARQSLRQAVYVFRRAMGKDAILSRGDEELAVNPERVSCDATGFEQGIVSGQAEKVLDSYAGDFLAGFFVSGATPEFDEWVATTRQRLRFLAANGAWAVAMQDERAGNTAGAAHWARRAVSFNPDDEEATRDLMILLARVGDRSGALRAYDQLANRLKTDFEATPSAELQKLALEMKSEAARFTPPMHAPPPQPRMTPGASVALDRRRPSQVTPIRRRYWRWVTFAGLAATAATILATNLVSEPARMPVFAVGEISDYTRPDSGAHASAFAALLATSIARVPSLDVVSSPRLHEIRGLGLAVDSSFTIAQAARSAGAGRLAEGDIRRVSEGLVLDLRIVELSSGTILHALRVHGADPFDLADRAAGALAAELKLAGPIQPLSAITTNSLVALRLYEQGLSAYYQSDFRAAGRLFSAALTEDPGFSMTAFFMAKVAYLLGEPSSDSLCQLAIELADRASDHDRLLIKGTIEQWRMLPSARAYAETLSVRYPSDVDGQLLLGQTLVWTANYPRAVEVLRGVIRRDSLSLNLAGVLCRACEAYSFMVDAYRNWDSVPAAQRSAREWTRRSPGSKDAWRLYWYALEGTSNTKEYFSAARMVDSLAGRPWNPDYYNSGLAIHAGRYPEVEADFRTRLETAEGRSVEETRWYLAIVLWQQGRLEEALELTSSPDMGLQLLTAQTLFLMGRNEEAAGIFLDIAGSPIPDRDGNSANRAAWNLTHAATAFAASGDTVQLIKLANLIEESGSRSLLGRDPRLHHYVRGLIARARNDRETAEREFRAAVSSWNLGFTRINYELARVLLETNRPAEAVRALQPAFRGSIEASNLYITRTDLHELLARAWDQAGNRDSARAHWRAVVEAWRGADPQFQSRWQTAVNALARR